MSRRDKIADDLLTVCTVKFCLSAVPGCRRFLAILNFPINSTRGLIWPLVKLNVICLLPSAVKPVCGVNSSEFISNGSNHESTVGE